MPSTLSSSSGFRVRRSSTSTDASPPSASAARSQTATIAPHATSVTSEPLARDAGLAELDDVLALGNRAARGAVDELRLEHDDRVGIADRGREQTLRVGRRRGHGDLHAGRVDVVRLRRVVVELGCAHAAAVGHAHDEREAHPAAGAPAVPADVRDQLVEARIREGVVLHLDDGTPAGHAEADGGAEDPGLGERRVDAAVGAEAIAKAGRRAEDAAQPADVLAEHHHGVVAGELDVQRVVDRLDEQELTRRHGGRGHLPCTRRRSSRSRARARRRLRVRVREDELDVARRLVLGLLDPRAHRRERLLPHRGAPLVVEHPEPSRYASYTETQSRSRSASTRSGSM